MPSRQLLPVEEFAIGDGSCENTDVATGANSRAKHSSASKAVRLSKPKSTSTRRTASEEKKSSSKSLSENIRHRFVVCLKNDGYRASLELGKLYEILSDDFATAHGMIRVIDESGEDYLFEASFFEPVPLPKTVEAKLRRITRRKPAA